MELIEYGTSLNDFSEYFYMAIEIPSGVQAWITPDDYLPSGNNYLHADWYEGDLN